MGDSVCLDAMLTGAMWGLKLGWRWNYPLGPGCLGVWSNPQLFHTWSNVIDKSKVDITCLCCSLYYICFLGTKIVRYWDMWLHYNSLTLGSWALTTFLLQNLMSHQQYFSNMVTNFNMFKLFKKKYYLCTFNTHNTWKHPFSTITIHENKLVYLSSHR